MHWSEGLRFIPKMVLWAAQRPPVFDICDCYERIFCELTVPEKHVLFCESIGGMDCRWLCTSSSLLETLGCQVTIFFSSFLGKLYPPTRKTASIEDLSVAGKLTNEKKMLFCLKSVLRYHMFLILWWFCLQLTKKTSIFEQMFFC